MTDDELLASAFRKILTLDRYSYLFVSEPGEGHEHLTLDDSYYVDDDLTIEELAAIRRVANREQADR